MLYICPTPIGNLGDITLRVLEVLKASDLVAAEDTRRTLKLLSHYGISKPLVSFYEHNELRRIPDLLARLGRGEKIALVSDAGMPGISDPGFRLIRAVIDEGLPIEVLPGPSAIETALVSSGFSTDAFIFIGYLPRRRGDLKAVLTAIASETRTSIAFETPHRLRATLGLAAQVLENQRIAVCRELTKKFQEISRGNAAELSAALPERVRGEIVLVFEGAPAKAIWSMETVDPTEAIALLLDEGLSPRRTAEIASRITGAPKNMAYKLALEIKKESDIN